MDEHAPVTVGLDENGRLADLQIDGEIDTSSLVEEVRPAPVPPVTDDRATLNYVRMTGIG